MALDCSVSALTVAARQFSALPKRELAQVRTYLLCQIANTPTAPPTPENIDISGTSDVNSVRVLWTVVGTPANIEVWKNVNGGAFALVSTLAGNAVQYIDPGVMPVNTYWGYKVRAKTGSDFSAFTSTVEISNDINIALGVVNYSRPDLVVALNNLLSFASAVMATFSVPKLHHHRFGSFGVAGCGSALPVVVTMPKLVECFRFDFYQSNLNSPISAPSLTTVLDRFWLWQSSPIAVDFPVLAYVGDDWQWDLLPLNTAVDLPKLVSVATVNSGGGQMAIADCSVTAINVPLLQRVQDGGVRYYNNDSITDISMPSLLDCGAHTEFSNDPALLSASFPILQTGLNQNYFGAGNMGFSGTPSSNLTALNVGTSWVPANGMTIDFQGCGLVQGSVDDLLVRCNNAGITGCTIDVSGGTNSPPSATGLAAAGMLLGAGNAVSWNP